VGTLPLAGGPYQLRVRDQSGFLPDVLGPTFQVVPGAVASMLLDQQPNHGVAGAPLDRPLKLHFQDACGNTGVTFPPQVSIALEPSPFYVGVLNGTTTASAGPDGTVTFDGLSISRDGAYVIDASAPGLPTVKTFAFTVDPGPARRYQINLPAFQELTDTSVSVVVQVVDDAGDPLLYSGTAAVTSDDPKATLPATVQFTGGAKTFNATFHTPGSHTLTLTEQGGPLQGSASIFVTDGPPSAASAGGGCSSADNADLAGLIAFALLAWRRRRAERPGFADRTPRRG
jgi:MYXO-CTERM domain-containing protein